MNDFVYVSLKDLIGICLSALDDIKLNGDNVKDIPKYFIRFNQKFINNCEYQLARKKD